MSKNCKMCGTANDDAVQFCSACGCNFDPGAVSAKPEAAQPKAGKAPARTMVLGVAGQAGMPTAVVPAAKPVAAAPVAKPFPAAQPAADPAPKKAVAKTMFGHPAAGPLTAPQPKPQAQAQPAPAPQRPAPAPMASPVPMAKPVSVPPPAAAQAASARDNRTVFGMAAAIRSSIPPDAPGGTPGEPAPMAKPSSPPPRPETRPLEPVSKPPPRPETIRLSPADAEGWDDEDDEPAPKRGGGKGMLALVIAAVVLIVAGVAAVVWLLVFRSEKGPATQLFPSADGQSLTAVVSFPDAPAGATVQAQGQPVQVVGGQARFDLPRDGLKVGQNSVPIVYTEPGSSPEQLTVPIFVRYTATTDLQGLSTATPSFSVTFQVAEGVQLAVNGKPVQTAGGRYVLEVPLAQVAAASGSGGSLIHRIPFQVSGGDGSAEQGQHVVTIPVTQLKLDRPAPDAIVALESVTCSGTADDGAVVTVNGVPAGVTAVGFRASVPLPAIGKHTVTVVARAPGKAPATETVEVTRIQSFEASIAGWSADLGAGLDYPTLARDPNLEVGKKLVLHGRIVNISTERGVTAFLLYVGEGCPAGAKCAVYVAFRGETDAGLQSMVDVYGKVRGTWDVQLEGGGHETMPALDADFVIRSDGAPAGKKKR